VSAGGLLRARLTAQLLAGEPARDPVTVARRLLAIQAQDARGARLAVRARSAGLSAADVNRALTEERSLVIGWLGRGTLHLVASEDYHWLHALTAPRLVKANARRLGQEGVSARAAERGVEVIERSLVEEGPLTRFELRDRLDRAGVRTAGQALVHLLMLACLRGVAVRGPMAGKQHAYALVRDWLGELGTVDAGTALPELARRYLAGHGPADDRDLAKWSGLPLRDARAGLERIASELTQRDDGLVDLAQREPPMDEFPPPRLLGPYEPLLLGWRSRADVLGCHDAAVVSGGLFRPIALAGGRAVGTWKLDGGRPVLDPFERLSAKNTAALEADAAEVERFLAPI
jgi:winged helix DNA-binding protein